MGDGIQRPADIIAFDIACQINSSVVAQCVSASFVISNILLMNACCHYKALSRSSHSLRVPGLLGCSVNTLPHRKRKVVALACLVLKYIIVMS